MISGYPSELYERRLEGWDAIAYRTMTRGGKMADERLWLNYRAPTVLHDDRYLGADFRERERIKRKRARWRRKFEALEPHERGAIWRDLTASIRETASADGGTDIGENNEPAASPALMMGSNRHA